MKTKQILILASFLSLMGMNACTNGLEDLDVLDLKSNPTILEGNEFSITSGDTEEQMSNNNLRLKSKKQVEITKNNLTIMDFFGTSNAFFPAYKKDFVHFELYPYDSLKNDTLMFHFRMDFLEEYVDSLLNDNIDYKVFEMKWKYNGHELSTIALYDNDDVLVYDNILFNLVIFKTETTRNNKKILSRYEFPNSSSIIEQGTESIKCYTQNVILGTASLWWAEYGHWGSAPIMHGTDLFAHCRYYIHDNTEYHIEYSIYYEGISFLYETRNFSVSDSAKFVYGLWIGPTDWQPALYSYCNTFVPGRIIDLSGTIVGSVSGGIHYEGFVKNIVVAPPYYIDTIQ